jgi:hypothetical protein
MIVKVELLAHGLLPGQIRWVYLPEYTGFESLDELLEMIYTMGQNDVQPIQGCPSVSMADVIHLRGKRYIVCATGFREIGKDECDRLSSLPQRDRRNDPILYNLTPIDMTGAVVYPYYTEQGYPFRVQRVEGSTHEWRVFELRPGEGGGYEVEDTLDDCDTEQEAVCAYLLRSSFSVAGDSV